MPVSGRSPLCSRSVGPRSAHARSTEFWDYHSPLRSAPVRSSRFWTRSAHAPPTCSVPDGEKIWNICLFVSTETTNVTDRQTERRTRCATAHMHSIARQNDCEYFCTAFFCRTLSLLSCSVRVLPSLSCIVSKRVNIFSIFTARRVCIARTMP